MLGAMESSRVRRDNLKLSGDLVYLHAGRRFTGIAVEEDGGRRIGETTFRRGIRHGIAREWDPNSGALVRETHYRGSIAHGIVESWFTSGRPRSLEFLDRGVRTMGVVWNESGEVVERFRLTKAHANFEVLQKHRDWLGGDIEPLDGNQRAKESELNALLQELGTA